MTALAFLDARILTICSYVWVHEWRERCEYAHGYTLVMLPPTSSLQWKYCRDEKPWHNRHQFPPTSWVVASYNRYVWNQFVVYFVLKSMTHQTQVFAKKNQWGLKSTLHQTWPALPWKIWKRWKTTFLVPMESLYIGFYQGFTQFTR